MATKKRAAHGSGNLRQRPDGRWEARFTYTDDLGQPKRGSVYAETQKECRQKLTSTLKAVDEGTYRKEKRITLQEWLKEWMETYCTDLKPQTIATYHNRIKNNINPHLGGVRLSALKNTQIQRFINLLLSGNESNGQKPLSPKTVKLAHGVLHKALEQAVVCGYLASNPADHVKLPKVKRPELKPLMDEDVTRFLSAIKGDPFERLFIVDLFSGLRQSELLGLQWNDIDLDRGVIAVRRQLQKDYEGSGYIFLDETKNGKERTATIAPSIVKVLREQQRQQAEWKLAAGELWENERGLVFTDEAGKHLVHHTVRDHFKKLVASIGLDETRFHDLRHSYAINALQNGDSPKEVSEQLGHYSSAFTMDVYAAVSDTMRRHSQERMEQYIKTVSDL